MPTGSGLQGGRLLISFAATGALVSALEPTDGRFESRLKNIATGTATALVVGPALQAVAKPISKGFHWLYDRTTKKLHYPILSRPLGKNWIVGLDYYQKKHQLNLYLAAQARHGHGRIIDQNMKSLKQN